MSTDTIGTRLAQLLKSHGMTQRALADAVGVSEVSVSRYIRGDRTPRAPILTKIARKLHTTADYLLSGSGDTDGDDPHGFHAVLESAMRHSHEWTLAEKSDLVTILFVTCADDPFNAETD